MTRWVCALTVLFSCMTAGACASSQSTAPVSVHAPHGLIENSKTYESVAQLLADTQVLAVVSVKTRGVDLSAPASQPASLVTLETENIIRGQSPRQVVVWQPGGRGSQYSQVQLQVGQKYLLCLARDPGTGLFFVVGGTTGEFAYDSKAQVFVKLDSAATWEPSRFPISVAEAGAGLYPEGGTTTTPSTTVAPPVPGACPPGCSLRSDYDALTVLASSATQVARLTVSDFQGTGTNATGVITVDQILQGNPHSLVYPPGPPSSIPVTLGTDFEEAGSYLVFSSFNRGGSCISALFSYDPATTIATLLENNDGANSNEIVLSGRTLPIPTTITLADVQARMYPTGGVVYPDDTAEWYCPGP